MLARAYTRARPPRTRRPAFRYASHMTRRHDDDRANDTPPAERGAHLTGRRATPGTAPGSLDYTGRHHPAPPMVHLFHYDAHRVEARVLTPEEALDEAATPRDGVRWLDVVGLGDGAFLAALGAQVGLHPLWVEDVVHVGQRPKVEVGEDAVLIILRTLQRAATDSRHDAEPGLDAEQISLALAPGLVVTFQERRGDMFDPVRQRIRRPGGQLRAAGADYLAYALVDVVVEGLFAVLEEYGEELAELEEEVFAQPDPRHLQRITRLRHEAMTLRRTAWPTRDLVAVLLRDPPALLAEETRTFVRDVHDHAVQVLDGADSLREVLAGLQDAALSTLSFRLNEVMRVLTIVSTVFVPLTFVAGVYGMNFEHMPELGWPYAYPLVWAVMLAMGTGMVILFRRRGWL